MVNLGDNTLVNLNNNTMANNILVDLDNNILEQMVKFDNNAMVKLGNNIPGQPGIESLRANGMTNWWCLSIMCKSEMMRGSKCLLTKQALSSGSRGFDNFLSVAISAQKAHVIPDTYKALSKAAIGAMVRVLCENSNQEAWKFSKLKDLRKDLKDKTQDEIIELMDAVDVLTIGCRTNPIPVQDIDDAATFSCAGCYKGAREITEILLKDKIVVPVYSGDGKTREPTVFVDGRLYQ